MIVITSRTVRDLALCERRAWLDAERADPAGDAPLTLGIAWDNASPLETRRAATWADAVAQTGRLMALGAASIFGACLELEAPLDLSDRIFTIRAQIDRLERVEHAGETLYAPVLLRESQTADDADWLALDLWVWLLDNLGGTPPPAELWLGVDGVGRARRRLAHEYDESRLLGALTRLAALLAQEDAPPVHLIEACKTCPHRADCDVAARQDGSLDLLYGVSRRVREGLRAAGLRSLAQVAAAPLDELQRVKGIGPASAPRIHANARAWLNARPVHLHPLPDICAAGGWMFDLETLERNGRVIPWCMGWCDVRGQTQIALVGPVQTPETLSLPGGQRVTLTPDSDSLWETLAESAEGNAPIFHWTGYDVALLRSTAPRAIRDALEPRFEDLHRHFTRAVSLPLRSTSIKAISTYLGYPWPGYNEWFAAYQDYRYWLDGGPIAALERACMYQRADVESMAWVWRWWASVRASAPESAG